MSDYQALSNMSIAELKQLLSCVNQDIQSIKKQKRREKIAKVNNEISEGALCNNIAKSFTKTVVIENIENKKIKQDIQIQQDILDYLNNGGHIICAKQRKSRYKF
jgi:hypothetical protein